MAAQVDVQTGEVGRTVVGGRLHLSPLADSSNSLIEVPPVGQSHIISPELNKPVPGPKPRLTPKPFTVERNPTIKPIVAPKPQTKPRPESTRLPGHKPELPYSPKPQRPVATGKTKPASPNPNRPASTSFKTGQTTKPVVQPFKPAPSLDPRDPGKPNPPVPPERVRPSSLAHSKSLKKSAEWSGTTKREDDKDRLVSSKGGTSITRAKSMGFLAEVGKEEEEEDRAKLEGAVQLRPQPRGTRPRPRPVSAIYLDNPSETETPVPSPRWGTRRPLSADLTSKFESIGLSLHRTTPKASTKENIPVEKTLPQKKEGTEGSAKPTVSEQSDKKPEEVRETEEDKMAVSVKSRISLLLDSPSSPGSDLQPQTEPAVGVKQLIKQLTEDTIPNQSPGLKPALRPRPLPLDLTKRFSSERSPDLGSISVGEVTDRHDIISKDPQRRMEDAVFTPSDQTTFVDLKDSQEQLRKAATPEDVHTVRASMFENIVERHSVRVVDDGKPVNKAKDLLRSPRSPRSPSFLKGSGDTDGSLVTAIYKEPASPSAPLRVLHAFDTVQAVEENRAVSENIPGAQREDKALTLRSRRSEGSRPAERTATAAGEPTPRYLRVGALQKWTTAGLEQEADVDKGMQKEPQREEPAALNKEWQREAEQEEVAAAPKRLKMLQADEPKPRATYFALTGQMQEPVPAVHTGINTDDLNDFSVRSTPGGAQGTILPVRRNTSLDEALTKTSRDQVEELMRRSQIRLASDGQMAEEVQKKETERCKAKTKELDREKQKHLEMEKEALLEFERMKEREMQREFERQRQKAFEEEKKRELEKQKLQDLERQRQLDKEKQELEKQRKIERERQREQERQRQREEERQREREVQKQKMEELDRIKELERQQLAEFQKQKQKEKERQQLMELEKNRLREKKEREEAEKIKQMALEQEMLRIKEIDRERERQRELEKEQQKELERQRQRDLDRERQRQLDMERQELENQRLRHREQEKERQRKEEVERIKEMERRRLLEFEKQRQAERDRQQFLDLEKQRQAERDRQQFLDLEKQRQAERDRQQFLDLEKQRQAERDRQQFLELEKQRQAERDRQQLLDLEKQRQAERDRQQHLDLEKQRQAERDRQQFLELEKQRQAERERQQFLELEKQRQAERDRLQLLELEKQRQAERERQQFLELEKQRQAEWDRLQLLELEKLRLREKMEREEAEKMRQVAKQQEAERQRLKEQERARVESLPLRPKVLDLDTVLRNDPLPKRSDAATRWKEPTQRAEESYKPSILDIDSFTAQLSPSKDFFPVSGVQGGDARLQPPPDISWKVPPQTSVGFTGPVWTPSPQDPWELRPVEMSVDQPAVEPRKLPNKVSPEQLLLRQEERLLAPQKRWSAGMDELLHLAPSPSTEARIGGTPGGGSDQIWLPRDTAGDGRPVVQSHRRSHGSQELNRMRSRSVSRRSAPPGSAVEVSLSRMRSRSAHREQDRHHSVQQKQSTSGDEEGRGSGDTPVRDTDSQYGTWETGLRSEDSLTPASPSSESALSPSPRKSTPPHSPGDPQGDTDAVDSLPPAAAFPDAPVALLDTSALRSRAQLGKKRAPRTRPTRAARQSAATKEGGATEDWLYKDSTEKKPESKEPEKEEQVRGADPLAAAAASSQPQRVALFPGMDQSALKAQLRKRNDSDNQMEAPAPSPSQPSRSPKSPFLPRAARVLPPAGGKENGEEESPQWLKELKTKKRLSHYDGES